jgi:hypothetical protein
LRNDRDCKAVEALDIFEKLLELYSICFTGSLAGIGKLPALAVQYLVWYFLYCKIWRELHFVKFCRNSFLLISRELIFPSKGGLDPSKRGQKPPFEGKKGFLPYVQYQNVPIEFSFGIVWENTGKIPTNTEPKLRIGVQL